METILLVQEEIHEQEALAAFLTTCGYVVFTTAEDGAAHRQREQVPDVIITSSDLGGSGGLELVGTAHRIWPETPVIVLGGRDSAASAACAIKQGAFDYLTRPIYPEVLLRAVQRAIERALLQREVRQLRQQSEEIDPMPRFRPGMNLQDLEREAIQYCLLDTGGSRQRTAEQLGISTRTLLRKIYDYGLHDPLRHPEAAHNSKEVCSA